MLQKLKIYADADTVWIKINGRENLPEVIRKLMVEEESIEETSYLQKEELEEVENIPHVSDFPLDEYIVDNTYTQMLQRKGPKMLAILYRSYSQYAKEKDFENCRLIKEGIKTYLQEVAENGFDAVDIPAAEVVKILTECKEQVFAKEIEQILQQSGVSDFDEFLKLDETLLRAALTSCMNNLYQKTMS